MIGKLAGAMGRRGILRGAVGLGAAVGIGGAGQVSRGAAIPAPLPAAGIGYQGPQLVGGPAPTRPDWLKALDSEAEAASESESARPRVDTLDLDLAALRGPSPAWKLLQQKARDRVRREAMKSIWQRLQEGGERWLRSIGR